MNFPSSLVLSAIQEKHVYKDEKSHERGTGVVKRKYKLAGRWPEVLREQNVRMFFVSTSSSVSVQRRSTVQVAQSDYVECRMGTLVNNVSHYDLTKTEILSGNELKEKREDPDNGFEDVAILSDDAFARFLEKSSKLRLQVRPPVSVEDIINITRTVADDEISDQILRDLHLIR